MRQGAHLNLVDERVARGKEAVLPYHHVDKLEDEDAWSLLKEAVLPY
jgi:hypothetical protein